MSIGTSQEHESKANPLSNPLKAKTQISIGTENGPEEYHRPHETPLFKKLQKTRLTKTRTKQLLRAAEREYNDPPPPPGLGDCCGSSCDPCVRDLWKEEIGVWRERWGDWAEEKTEKTEEKTTEKNTIQDVSQEKEVSKVKLASRGVKKSLQKDLEW